MNNCKKPLSYTQRSVLISTALLSLLLSAQSSSAAKLYKWVDNNGNISYQDSPPPEGSTLIREENIETTSNPTQGDAQTTEPVTVYTVDNCEACDILVLRLQRWNIPVNEQSLQNRAVQTRILELSDSLQAPTLFIGDQMVSDISGPGLTAALRQAGYLIETSNDNSNATDLESDVAE